MKLSRRNFMKGVAALGATAFLTTYKSEIVEALTEVKDYWHICWLNGAACTGCTISFAQATEPDLVQILTEITVGTSGLPIALPDYMETIHPASGSLAERLKKERWEKGTKGRRILVVEGSVQEEGYCEIAGKDFRDHLREAAEIADAIVAVGQCATFGGIPAAKPNPTGAMSVQEFLKQVGINKTVINLPFCPAHPDHITVILAAVMIGAPIELDKYGRPKVFFSTNMHDELCPYRPYYDRGLFTTRPGEEGCRFKMGCKGPIVWTDCALRKWNNHTSYCVETNMCIGCAEPGWPDRFSPFYSEVSELPTVLGFNATKIGEGILAATAAGIAIHAVKHVASKGKHEEKKE
ncbi:hydrogenase small subunit [Archaeoglobus veneficus]|uniref:Hydrogenase (NiFe) small subunit HydA n=1 Tax=Archaeoglobus veneficus (strain DSM 11195 / SNP6) TaxID=693661 RepID=F2KN81_ARCVS|nr:hydrogenase small subunit [Archaeoglobus veneficus]AEA46182.1 hydrogenase (NiFe) small subunit HydA [Archaeoglobus veneficus SNP6]